MLSRARDVVPNHTLSKTSENAASALSFLSIYCDVEL